MTYADLLSVENTESQFLVVLRPRVVTETWTLHSGTVYKKTFTLGHVYAVKVDGTAYTEDVSTALSSGEWYFDYENSVLYINTGGDPATKFIVTTYELYVGTYDAHTGRVPTDSASRQVYFEPMITKSPTIKQDNTDIAVGFSPVQATQMECSNVTGFFNQHFYESSFTRAEIEVYHWLHTPTVTNTSKILSGLVSGAQHSDAVCSFTIEPQSSKLDQTYSNPDGVDYYTRALFPNIDPKFEDTPIRTIYGTPFMVEAVNIDYNASETGTNNRIWVVGKYEATSGNVAVKVVPGNNVANKLYLEDTAPFKTLDFVQLKNDLGTVLSGLSVKLKGTDGNGDYVDIGSTSSTNFNLPTPDKYIYRCQASFVRISGSPVNTFLLMPNAEPGGSYNFSTYVDLTNGVVGIQIKDNFEGAGPYLDPDLTKVFVSWNGPLQTNGISGPLVTKSAVAFGTHRQPTASVSSAAQLIYKLLKQAGVAEADIDGASFDTFYSANTDVLDLLIPSWDEASFPTYEEVINRILYDVGAFLFINSSNKFEIKAISTMGAYDWLVEDDEILSISSNFSESDLVTTAILQAGRSNLDIFRSYTEGEKHYIITQSTNSDASSKHSIKKQKTFNTNHSLIWTDTPLYPKYDTGYTRTRDLYLNYHSEPRHLVEIRVPQRFMTADIGDVVRIQRTRLPGFEYTDALRYRDYIIVGFEKTRFGITLTLDANKGLETWP